MANNVNVEKDELLHGCIPELERNHPWLVITHGEEFERQTFYSILENRYFTKEIPEMRNKQISQASYGWLLMIDCVELVCCLINPKTMETVQLPQVVSHGAYRCVLSKPPTEPDCHILLMGGYSILFCRVGDSKFIQRQREIDGGHLHTATNFQGEIFAWMGERRGLVIIDFVNEDIVLKNLVTKNGHPCQFPCSSISPPNSGVFDDYLIESCGELLLVHLISCPSYLAKVSSYRIFRINIFVMEWEELHSIGDRAIFLSRYGSMAMLTPSKETRVEADTIYYLSITQNNKNLYAYHIEDRSQTMLLPFREVDGVQSLKSWIMI